MSTGREPSFGAVCAAGFVALAVAMGIGRFAFTPVLPLMIQAGSVDLAGGGWLAAANYAGYLAGALSAARVRLAPQQLAIAALVAVALSTAAMGWTASPLSWALLRFAAGVASAWVLVSTSVWCLGRLANSGRTAGAGVLYAGVGAGIALAGMWCWHAGASAVAPESLWLQLGAFAVAGIVLVVAAMPRPLSTGTQAAIRRNRAPSKPDDGGLVVCYGLLGFGYILPATFLPVLARAVIADPALFGIAWPVFGAAAAASTLLAGVLFARVSRRRVLAGSHLLMAVGCLLPVLHLSPLTVLAAALLVGSTFMVATMAGMQAARAETDGDPTRALGRLTAAFAIGQLAGPMLSSLLSTGSDGFGGLMMALCAGALALLASAGWLWRSRP
ncbi:MAG: YbfB/YjiJ family MFS transporter [Caldimonas sp.]